MALDKQGRISLGAELAEELEYELGMECRFVYEGNKTFRLVPTVNLLSSDKVVGPKVEIDSTGYCVQIPNEIRQTFGENVLIYGNAMEGYLYFEFQDQMNEILSKISLILEKLA